MNVMKKWIKRGVIATVVAGILAVLAAVLCFYVVWWSAADSVYDNVEDVEWWPKKLEIAIVRESLARVKMYLDLLLSKKPKFLGEKIIIETEQSKTI